MVDGQLGTEDPKAPPAALVIFGASGDLTRCKLIPGLANLVRHKLLPDEFAVVSVGRSDLDDEAFRRFASEVAPSPLEQFRFVRGGYDAERHTCPPPVVSAGRSSTDPIIAHWANNTGRVPFYVAASWGPVDADQFLHRDGRAWHNA